MTVALRYSRNVVSSVYVWVLLVQHYSAHGPFQPVCGQQDRGPPREGPTPGPCTSRTAITVLHLIYTKISKISPYNIQ